MSTEPNLITTGMKLMEPVALTASESPAESLTYRREPVPLPGPNEVIVELHVASVNLRFTPGRVAREHE
jgi:hypothetical protein